MRLRSATDPKILSSQFCSNLETKKESSIRQWQAPIDETNNNRSLNFSISNTTEKRKTSSTPDAVRLAPGLSPKTHQNLTQEASSSLPCRRELTFHIDEHDVKQMLFTTSSDQEEQLEANSDWDAFKSMSVRYQNKIKALLGNIIIDEPDLLDAADDDEIIPRRKRDDRIYKGDQKREDILQLAYLLRSIGWSWNGIAKVTGMSHTNLRNWIKADKKPPTHYAYEIENDNELFTIKITNPRLSSWAHPVRLYLMMLLNKSNLSPKQFLKENKQYVEVAQKSALYHWKNEDAMKRPEFWKKYYPKRPPRKLLVVEKIKNDKHLFRVLNGRQKFFPHAVKEYIVMKRRASGLPVDHFLNSALGKSYKTLIRKSTLYMWEKEV